MTPFAKGDRIQVCYDSQAPRTAVILEPQAYGSPPGVARVRYDDEGYVSFVQHKRIRVLGDGELAA